MKQLNIMGTSVRRYLNSEEYEIANRYLRNVVDGYFCMQPLADLDDYTLICNHASGLKKIVDSHPEYNKIPLIQDINPNKFRRTVPILVRKPFLTLKTEGYHPTSKLIEHIEEKVLGRIKIEEGDNQVTIKGLDNTSLKHLAFYEDRMRNLKRFQYALKDKENYALHV